MKNHRLDCGDSRAYVVRTPVSKRGCGCYEVQQEYTPHPQKIKVLGEDMQIGNSGGRVCRGIQRGGVSPYAQVGPVEACFGRIIAL